MISAHNRANALLLDCSTAGPTTEKDLLLCTPVEFVALLGLSGVLCVFQGVLPEFGLGH